MKQYFSLITFQYKHQHKPNFSISEQGLRKVMSPSINVYRRCCFWATPLSVFSLQYSCEGALSAARYASEVARNPTRIPTSEQLKSATTFRDWRGFCEAICCLQPTHCLRKNSTSNWSSIRILSSHIFLSVLYWRQFDAAKETISSVLQWT